MLFVCISTCFGPTGPSSGEFVQLFTQPLVQYLYRSGRVLCMLRPVLVTSLLSRVLAGPQVASIHMLKTIIFILNKPVHTRAVCMSRVTTECMSRVTTVCMSRVTNSLYVTRNNSLYVTRNNTMYVTRNNSLYVTRNNNLYME